jgi:hypothetical protein
MKYFYSYYPLESIESDDVFFNLLCIKLSSTILKKNNKTIGIYSTKKFIDLLKSYKIELDFYIDIEDELKDVVSHKLFAMSKIYSNMIQTEPFMQIDCDMILFDNFDFDKFEKSSIFFYFTEKVDYKTPYKEFIAWKKLYMDFYYKINDIHPYITNEQFMNPLVAYNCAIVGGTDWRVFQKSYKAIFEFIVKNKKYIESTSEYPMPELEQQLIVGFLSKYGYNIDATNFVELYPTLNVESLDRKYLKLMYNKNQSINLYWDDENESYLSMKVLELKKEKFGGNLHITGIKSVLGIRNLIYEMLKIYDIEYVNWLEANYGIQFQFQKDLYKKII